jgi:hypothetical protein
MINPVIDEYIEVFFDKGTILISKDTNYTQHLQQRNTLTAVRMHTTKKR